jgi:hypothetical protein
MKQADRGFPSLKELTTLMEEKCLILETLRPSANIANVKGRVGTTVLSHHLFNVHCKRGCSAGKILSSETKVCCNCFRQGHRARTCQPGHCRSSTKKHYTLIHKSMMRLHPYNTVRHEQVQVHQISHLYGHDKRTRCQRSITHAVAH